ncbi:Rieske 2Fe-2S domain-containing protein [Flavobacterium frigoris]|uniref:Ferredoxin subunit of nitrite reductase or a ring-hydroxylating dioxygenase n=1 Tax=Flavobacterium frigoris TaxID=229204 RepID=A0A1H9J5B0_FLAFI|nr:Rieske 2Fe-2S domain-containing protein [Flavobacterium frigoris]SEQ82064.1 Ferredoxin subunit of nitrite reductase or a ring-hydroxylating dioxygenase [Flavobacterium frigoris]
MDFIKVASLSELPEGSSKIVKVKNSKVALFHFNGKITAIGNACLHKGGPLGLGCIEKKYDGTYVTCPWHGWEYNIQTGTAPPGYKDQQAVYEIKIKGDAVLISEEPIIKAKKATHDLSALDDLIHLKYQTTATSINILGISTTNMNDDLVRFSTSENALEKALAYATEKYGAETKMIKLRQLNFRHCEGYYSQHMNACTWPCSVTEMDVKDGMTQVYRDMVLWADVVLVATPIRWGNASSLYYKMAERLNTVQNQITLKKKILIQNKVAAFIITGGQDNIQAVAGQLMVFFTDLGFVFPPFSFLGWSRGWTAEDMDKNVLQFKKSEYIKRTTKEMIDNCVETLSQIKKRDIFKIIAPKPHRQDSLSADIDNPEMNI